MFVTMAMLVEEQGDLIDRIEYNVNDAADYVGKATVHLRKAVVYNTSRRRVCVCLLVCLFVLLCAFVHHSVPALSSD